MECEPKKYKKTAKAKRKRDGYVIKKRAYNKLTKMARIEWSKQESGESGEDE